MTEIQQPIEDGPWLDAVRERGRKRLISLRIDQDVLDAFRAKGPRYQTRINAVLRAYARDRLGMSDEGL